MNHLESSALLNRFAVKNLNEAEKTVYTYSYTFNPSPESGKEYKAINRMLWKIWTPGERLGSTIVTKEPIQSRNLQGENWVLKPLGRQLLDLSKHRERDVLEKLERRWLGNKLRQGGRQNRVDRCSEGGFIWWNEDKIILQKSGWEVHKGVHLDVEIHHSGVIFVEVDSHHRFYSSWTLSRWLDTYPELPVNWVRNTYNDDSWKYLRTSEENPETTMIPGLGSLADYHRNLNKHQATEAEISNAKVVYVKGSKGKELTHLSTRLRPSVTMEILSHLADLGQAEATQVFSQVRKSVRDRFTKAEKVAAWLAKNIYRQTEITPKPTKTPGIILRQKKPLLLTKSGKVYNPAKSLERGCFRCGEKQFGCLDLTGDNKWPETIRTKLQNIGKKSDVELLLEKSKTKADLPDSIFARKQFWRDWANHGTYTALVVSPWLKNDEKTQLRKEALEANIALQFMQPMLRKDDYRAVNILLGLLVKAKWLPVGLEPLQDNYAAEIVIGFDAGTNRSLYYGTSAFAILANGQSLGWELPEAQPGEKLSVQAVLNTVANIITRFQRIENRLPRRVLLLRDGLVQCDEFEETVCALQRNNIAVDLLGVRKSGAGRMAVKNEFGELIDAAPGTAILAKNGDVFRIVTSKAKAGGSARPLQVFRDRGDASLEVLAHQVDRLCMLNPASGFFPSRLPYVIHFADKMAKEVQRLSEVGVLQGVDRNKIFFA